MPRKTHDDSLETRRNILNSALRLFSRRGFERTSLSDIAKFSGVTRGAVYWHFENKEDLFVALCEDMEKQMFSTGLLHEASEQSEEDPLGKLRQWLINMADDQSASFLNSTVFSIVSTILNGNASNELLHRKLMKFAVSRRDFIALIIRNAICQNQLPSNLNVMVAVEHIAIFIVGFIYQSRLGLTDFVIKNFEKVVDCEIRNISTFTSDALS